MGQKENRLKSAVLNNLKDNEILYRFNSGMAWAGKIIDKKKNTIKLLNPRPFFGAEEGTPDLLGWKSIVVTPDMVGKNVAVFWACELKATGEATDEQNAFIKKVNAAGGIGEVVRVGG